MQTTKIRSFILAVGLLFASLTQAHHLTFANGSLHAHAVWLTGPQTSTESILQIDWKSGADHSPVEPPGDFDVVLWMSSMGHGSAPTHIERITNEQGQIVTGGYRVSNIYFIMPGDWQVNVTLKRPGAAPETRIIPVVLSGGGGHH